MCPFGEILKIITFGFCWSTKDGILREYLPEISLDSLEDKGVVTDTATKVTQQIITINMFPG